MHGNNGKAGFWRIHISKGACIESSLEIIHSDDGVDQNEQQKYDNQIYDIWDCLN